MKRLIASLVCAGLAGCAPQLTGSSSKPLWTTDAEASPVSVGPARLTEAQRGLDIADRNCSLCHGITKAARSSHPRAPTFAKLGATYPVEALRAGLSTGSVIGHKGMPQIELAPGQIKDLIAYMATIASPKAAK